MAPYIEYIDRMAKRRKKQQKAVAFRDQLRREIEAAGVSFYRISKDTGVDVAVMSKFMSGQRGMSLDTVDILVAYFGLELKKGKN